jgi:hypothetical protein
MVFTNHYSSPGQESADNARVWDVYQQRAIKDDDDLMEGANETINIVLVFVRTCY